MSNITRLEEFELCHSMGSLHEASDYLDALINTIPEEHRLVAYTGAYVLYNTAVKHYDLQLDKRSEDG